MRTELLKQNSIKEPASLLIITKLYLERRAVRTIEKQWIYGRPEFYAMSPGVTVASYVSLEQPMDDVINIMVGNLHRIMTYPEKGFMTKSDMPRDVLRAFEYLINAGFTKHM